MENKKDKKIIGLLGGTFNPIHNGHIELAKQAHKQFHLEEILVMPSGDPSSYKDDSKLASAIDRCNMIEEAIHPFPYMKLSKLEVNRDGHTYTSDTLRELNKSYDEIYFIIGADSLLSIQTWYEPQYVLENCHILAANRNNESYVELQRQKQYLETQFQAKVDFLQIKELPISSTEIRNHFHEHKSVDSMIPESVYNYIQQHNLY